MNPNLKDLAKRTKNPGIKAEKLPPIGFKTDLAFILDSCKGVGNALFSEIYDAIKEMVARSSPTRNSFCALNYGQSTHWCSFGWKTSPALHDIIGCYAGGNGYFEIEKAEKWREYMLCHHNPAYLVVADSCSLGKVVGYLSANNVLKAGIVHFGREFHRLHDFLPVCRYYHVKKKASEIVGAINDYVRTLA
jgi:hypothetical protein